MKTYRQLLEDIELVSGISRATRSDIGAAHDEFKHGGSSKKNLGKIHNDYSIHKSGGDFFITHDKTKKVVGHIANETPHKSKSLQVGVTAMHPDHTKKKIGHSLAIAAYKHLHDKHGYEIHSGDSQSSWWCVHMAAPDEGSQDKQACSCRSSSLGWKEDGTWSGKQVAYGRHMAVW